MRHATLMLLILTFISCAPSRSAARNATRKAERGVAPLAEDPATALAWLPAEFTWIQHQGGGHVPILDYLKSRFKNERPACFDRFAAEVDHAFGLCRFVGDRMVNAWHGISDRDSAERCAGEVWKALTGRQLKIEREGSFTRMRDTHSTLYVAWSDDGWLYHHDDPAPLESLLKRGSTPTLAASLRPLLSRVSFSDVMWNVAVGDILGPFIGVKSTALVQRFEHLPDKTPASLPVRFIFPNPGDASRAREAIVRAGDDPVFPEPLRRGLASLSPQVIGTEIEVDVRVFLTEFEVMKAAGEWLQQEMACRKGKLDACHRRATGEK
jgi:hypothetical protein